MQQQAHRPCADALSRLSSPRRRPKVRVQPVVRSGSHPLLPPLPHRTLAQQHLKDEAEKTDTASEGEGEESYTEAEEADVHGLRLQVTSVSSGLDVSDEWEGLSDTPHVLRRRWFLNLRHGAAGLVRKEETEGLIHTEIFTHNGFYDTDFY